MKFLKGTEYLGPIAISLCSEWVWSEEKEEEVEVSKQEMKRGSRKLNISDSEKMRMRTFLIKEHHVYHSLCKSGVMSNTISNT